MGHRKRVTDADYQRLLEFRTGLRRFLRWSADQAAGAGLTPTVHQLLLAIRGHPDRGGPTIREVADYLLVRHHSVVQLVDRAEASGLVERLRDTNDGRNIRLRCTKLGETRLQNLTEATLQELSRLKPALRKVWDGLEN